MKGSHKIYVILSTLLLTAVFYSLYYAPLFIGKLMLLMILGAIAEAALVLFQKTPLRNYGLGSAFAAGLLTCSLPDKMPIWQLLIGVLFASWIVKPLLPRIGIRLNSALAARLLLMLLFPTECTTWGVASMDTLSTATPQELYRAEGAQLDLSMLLWGPIQGNWMDFYTIVPGSPGSNFPFLLLVVILFFSWKNLCNRYTILAYAFSFSIFNGLNGLDPLITLSLHQVSLACFFFFLIPIQPPKVFEGKFYSVLL